MNYAIFVSVAKGLEYLLEAEVKNLGLNVTQVSPQGVFGKASLATIYRLCLWARLANRVQLVLFSGKACEENDIYKLCNLFSWQSVFSVDKTFLIEFHGGSEKIRHSLFGAQLVKDAIVDHFRNVCDKRPSVDKENPDILLHAHLNKDILTLSLDLTGYSLHQRGYRQKAGDAPLKETLAAAMLVRANWPDLAEKGYALLDPFCGSGTLVIEAAMMTANMAPGLLRTDQSLEHWVEHQPKLWSQLRAEALQEVRSTKIKFLGSDSDKSLVNLARENAAKAGVSSLVEFVHQKLEDSRPTETHGLIIANPPYGERLQDAEELQPLYQQLGSIAHQYFQGWQLAFITSNPLLAKAVGLKSAKQYSLYNGPLKCKLYTFELNEQNRLKDRSILPIFSPGAEMFANRLKKNYQHLKKWAERQNISCYRVYDADLPDYAYAIDIYNNYAMLQEYQAPATIDPVLAEQRSLELVHQVPVVLGIAPQNLVIKQRKQQKGSAQYEKLNQTNQSIQVQEGEAIFKVNLYDYLDTGLFLDHRKLRLSFAKLPAGTKFLNCFCYTSTASVHAALAGAFTTNVDLSNTYLQWSEDNFRINSIKTSRHQFIQYDCLEWMALCRDKFDVIFLDPPSFSNSKRMKTTLDVQRDHVLLIRAGMQLLAAGGILYFSTNLRHFKLDEELTREFSIKNISASTIDLDFKRSQRIHTCFQISESP